MTHCPEQSARTREMAMRDLRRRLNRVVKLAADRLELDQVCEEAYALMTREHAMGLRGPELPGTQAVVRYTDLDDRWVARREQLPAELTAAFDAATALVRLVETSAVLLHETGGRA